MHKVTPDIKPAYDNTSTTPSTSTATASDSSDDVYPYNISAHRLTDGTSHPRLVPDLAFPFLTAAASLTDDARSVFTS